MFRSEPKRAIYYFHCQYVDINSERSEITGSIVADEVFTTSDATALTDRIIEEAKQQFDPELVAQAEGKGTWLVTGLSRL